MSDENEYIPYIGDADAQLRQASEKLYAELNSDLAEKDPLGTRILKGLWDGIRGAAAFMWEKAGPIIAGANYTGYYELVKKSQERDTDKYNEVRRWIKDKNLLDNTQLDELEGLFKVFPFFEKHSSLIVFAMVAIQIIGKTMAVTGAELQQNLAAQVTPFPPSPSSVLRTGFIAPELYKDVIRVFKRNGISEEDAKLMFVAQYSVYPIEQIRDLYLRKDLTLEQATIRLKEHGFTDTRIAEMTKLWKTIPSPQDLITMLGREAFEEDIVSHIGLDAEFPETQVQWFEAHGLSREWQQKYWRAHWNQPAIGQGFQMLWRNIINSDDLEQLFKIQEIPPYWRKKLLGIAYSPYTRVDVRRMHDMNVLDDPQTLQAYKDIGYDENKAQTMLEWTIKYNHQNDRELTRSQIVAGKRKKRITREEAIAYLETLKYTNKDATFIIDYDDYVEAEKLQDKKEKQIRRSFVNRVINTEEAKNKLFGIGLDSGEVSTLIDEWETDIEIDTKIPKIEELIDFYVVGVIDDKLLSNYVNRLGYSTVFVNYYISLAEARKEAYQNV